MTMENGHLWLSYLVKMVIFHSHVSLLEGNILGKRSCFWRIKSDEFPQNFPQLGMNLAEGFPGHCKCHCLHGGW